MVTRPMFTFPYIPFQERNLYCSADGGPEKALEFRDMVSEHVKRRLIVHGQVPAGALIFRPLRKRENVVFLRWWHVLREHRTQFPVSSFGRVPGSLARAIAKYLDCLLEGTELSRNPVSHIIENSGAPERLF